MLIKKLPHFMEPEASLLSVCVPYLCLSRARSSQSTPFPSTYFLKIANALVIVIDLSHPDPYRLLTFPVSNRIFIVSCLRRSK